MTIRSSYIVMIQVYSDINILSFPISTLQTYKNKIKEWNIFIIKEIIYIPVVFSVESLKTCQLGCLHLPRTT